MKKGAVSFLAAVLLVCGGCATSLLSWRPAEGTRCSSSGDRVLWDLQGSNKGFYLFYWITIFCGDSNRPNRSDYDVFRHRINEKHAYVLLRSRLKPLKADAVEDVSVTFQSNGWYGLGIVWVRSLSARGVAVKKAKKKKNYHKSTGIDL